MQKLMQTNVNTTGNFHSVMQYLVDLDLIEADHNSLIVNKFILSTFPPLYIVTCKCTLASLETMYPIL